MSTGNSGVEYEFRKHGQHMHLKKMTVPMRKLLFCFAMLVLLGLRMNPDAAAGEIVDAVKTRGLLRCGVSEGIPGFSERDRSGHWRGFDVDFCRAMAAALLGDAKKVVFVPLKASMRFPALKSRMVDILARNTTWTMMREASLQVQFPVVLFYDGQGFMVSRLSNIKSAADLAGATVCVEKGTTHEFNLLNYFNTLGKPVKTHVVDSAAGAAAALFAGRCQAYTSDASQLAGLRLKAPTGPDSYVILPERISKEPLSPVVLRTDGEWVTAVRWVGYMLVLSEELGITRDNAEARLRYLRGEERRIFGNETGSMSAQALGFPDGWGMRAVKAVGNYSEMYERNFGRDSALPIERGLNRLWNKGGLMYAPPPR